MSQPFWPPENYYRVSVKALIFDSQERVLVCADKEGTWAMPGGGWDHGEDYQAGVMREVAEELGVTVRGVGRLTFFYRCQAVHGQPKICLVFPVTLENFDFTFNPDDDEVIDVRFVTKEEFLKLHFQDGEAPVQEYADQIWPAVEKKSRNR